MRFTEFFEHATGKKPYAYQRLLAEGGAPDALIAPTGLGKTAAVILAWLWRRRADPDTTPRRLVYCLPMRTLVEQTADNAREWLGRLAQAGLAENLPAPGDLHLLMGGVESRPHQPRWSEFPERSAILIGTQDMLISRALMRGYAAGRARWPAEFALLHNDAFWVFDEVQLMGAGLATSTQLQAFREAPRLGPARRTCSLWVSATLDPAWLRSVDYPDGPRTIRRVPDDVPEDAAAPAVRRRLEAYKPVTRAAVAPAGTKKPEIDAYVRALAELVRDVHGGVSGGRTLVIVNTVERAQKLHAALLKAGASESDLVLVHSRFRPADRRRQMQRLQAAKSRIVVATQAIEAGVDLSSAALVTELAPWSSLVQRFGRVNRRGERPKDEGGAPVHWIDLVGDRGDDDKDARLLAQPYPPAELRAARDRLLTLADAAPVHLRDPGDLAPPRRVIRRKDLIDLFDTDPDLTGFDVDISPYVRDADDTDVHVFWRDLSTPGDETVRPSREELCAVSIGKARDWIASLRRRQLPARAPDPQWREGDRPGAAAPPGWRILGGDEPPWPGMTLLVDVSAGGYEPARGFVGEASSVPVEPIRPTADETVTAEPDESDADQQDGDARSADFPRAVTLVDHTAHVVQAAVELCDALDVEAADRDAILRAARWHDLGKAHDVFQSTMRRGLRDKASHDGVLLAKTEDRHLRHARPYFRHELASALAFLSHVNWSCDADLVAYLVAAHHGKVRMSLRALPAERAPDGEKAGARFARGVWDGDTLPAVDLGGGEIFAGGPLTLSVMELGEDEITGASWTERTRALLDRHGPFRLAWLEALLTIADWRASAGERRPAGPRPDRGAETNG
ncbi:CRISPR-associated endonuclease Cas3'' [Rhodoplanes azumiensis]|uniref:CRISPR-associated endonuclease Cas3 n=1 Tax=Rhodoplanes azumiensis TaxID=1897628 RepID=A0ABW5AJ43_9BRAD